MSRNEVKKQLETFDHPSGTPDRWKVLSATFLAYFYDSFDIIILAIAMPVLIKILGITLPEGGLLASATMIGAATGSILLGLLAENRGRKLALLLSLFLFGVGTGCVYLVHTWGEWMILRFVTGIFIGGAWGPCVALISMHWTPQYRARAGAFMLSTFAIGGIAASFVGRLVLSLDWRLMFLVGATSIFAGFYAWWAIPNDQPASSKNKSESGVEKGKIGLGSILVGETGKRVILATLLNVFIMGAWWGSATWIPTFLAKERGLSLIMMANFSVFLYIGMFFGYQFFGYLGDRLGRKKALMFSFLTCIISIPVYILISNGIFLFWWGMVVGFGYGGPFGIVGAFFAELFPENIRALAGGFCFNVGRIGAVVAPFTVGVLGKMYGLEMGLLTASCMSVIGLFVLLFLPETAVIKDLKK
jgi:MFS family permease